MSLKNKLKLVLKLLQKSPAKCIHLILLSVGLFGIFNAQDNYKEKTIISQFTDTGHTHYIVNNGSSNEPSYDIKTHKDDYVIVGDKLTYYTCKRENNKGNSYGSRISVRYSITIL